MNRLFLLCLGACASATQLTPGQRMELIEQLDHSAAFAKKCGLGKSEMRVRFSALPNGQVAEPVVTMGAKGKPQQAACVMSQLHKVTLSPHDSGIVVRTERMLPTGRKHTDEKLAADQSGLSTLHIDHVIATSEPARKACLDKKPSHGNLTLFFLIDPTGKVSDVLVESKIDAPEVEWCMLDVFKDLEFDKPSDGGYVEVVRQYVL